MSKEEELAVRLMFDPVPVYWEVFTKSSGMTHAHKAAICPMCQNKQDVVFATLEKGQCRCGECDSLFMLGEDKDEERGNV